MSEIKLSETRACFCVGPQDGNPVCPCRMQGLRKVGGRWIEIIDHGPSGDDGKKWPESREEFMKQFGNWSSRA